MSRLIGGSAFIFACRVGGAAITFLSQILLARFMGAAELGVYVTAFSACILLSTVATLGFPMAAIRFIGTGLARKDAGYVAGFMRHGRRGIVLAGLAVALACAGGLLVAGDAVAPAYRAPLLIALAAVPFFAVLEFNGGVANAFTWLGQAFLPGNIVRPLLFLGSIWLMSTLPAAGALTAATALQAQWVVIAIVAVGSAVALRFRSQPLIGAAVPSDEWGEWLRVALPLVGVTLFSAYLPEFVVVLGSLYLQSDQVAILQVSYRVALLIAFGLYSVDAYTAPETARLMATTDKAELSRLVRRVTRLRFWTAVLAVIVLAAVGRALLGLFGAEFVAGYTVLLILALAQLPQAAAGPVLRLMTISGHQDQALIVCVASLGLLVPLVMVFTPLWGMTGLAVAVLLTTLLWSVAMSWLVVRYLGIRPAII